MVARERFVAACEDRGPNPGSRSPDGPDAVHADVQEVKQSAISASSDGAAADPEHTQLLVRDHRVLAGGDRADEPIRMFERYRNLIPADRDRSNISYMLER